MAADGDRLTLTGLRDLINERDKRYDVLFAAQKEALSVAVIAINRQTEAAFQSAQKAIDKAEQGQKQYNDEHNNLSRRMVAIEKYDSDQKNMTGKIEEIKISISEIQKMLALGSGSKEHENLSRGRNQWIVIAIISATSLISNIIMFIVTHK